MEYKLEEISKRIDALIHSSGAVIVAIDGNCCAGKSTLAARIADIYECNLFHMDHFFLPPGLKTPERLIRAGENIDYERFHKEVILGINSQKPFKYKIYCCKKERYIQTVYVEPKKLNLVEGVYSMHPSLINYYSLKIFLHIDKYKQEKRILKRNGELLYKRFKEEWIPMEDRYFKEFKISEDCDIEIFG